MPTKKKRVGFIPREDVMKIIDKLSIENNLSNSKIINILVEEALSIRGIFNKKSGKLNQSYSNNDNFSKNLFEEINVSQDSQKLTNNINFGNQNDSLKSAFFKENNQETFDLQTYKKFLLFLKFKEMIDGHSYL
ncbi:hypothetical protein OA006_01310 [Prochlorococcus sp. AH-736-D21]|nr:hypothetical protein [Prochlorococcus sp. AH-736-D21]